MIADSGWTGLVRVYFNSRAEAPFVWSSVVRGGLAALRAGWSGDTSPPAGCCIGTYDSIWELLENSARYAESLSAQQLMSPVWELLDFMGRILWRHSERNPSAQK